MLEYTKLVVLMDQFALIGIFTVILLEKKVGLHTLVALDCSASSLTFLSSSSKSWIFCCSFDLTACKDLISSRNISCSLHA